MTEDKIIELKEQLDRDGLIVLPGFFKKSYIFRQGRFLKFNLKNWGLREIFLPR